MNYRKRIATILLALLLALGPLPWLQANGEAAPVYVNVQVDSTLNLREKPDTDAKILGSLTRGFVVTVLDTQGAWTKVQRNGAVGWVYSVYLSTEFPPVPLGGAYTVIAEPTVNVRDLPNGNVIARLKTGSTVYMFDRQTDENGVEWAKLEEGWAMRQYIEEVPDED